MRVLIYESSLQIRESIITILIMAGYDVVAVKEKKQILNMLEKRPFKIAVIDVLEDDEEIKKILETICTDERYGEVKVIAHIGEGDKEFMTNMIRIGAIGFLLRPFNEKDFLSRFNAIMEKADLTPKRVKYLTVNDFNNFNLVFRDDENNRILSAKIIELSPLGLKFIVPHNYAEDIDSGKTINDASMSIGAYDLSFSINIADKNGNEFKGFFKYISSFNRKLICKFIHDKNLEKIVN